ncbi:amino acid ABC transporter substrate-binding protein (PAAT family) [Humitalea rosea]|uniref:Amino acid ABC transporter substrate-binding protein (PAAT family) n=1 Tax=Humitalea rosea TaxID=990373 RepID=A0A2W7J064_9PROT|nr:ABC transporter substrate-binding protein [Humitalea rosea]PZW45011.1 amino acid ABC transporter substrate-binding protein (PAAT family) [Humitalea rosea]
MAQGGGSPAPAPFAPAPPAAPAALPPTPAPERLTLIRQRGALLVCIWPEYYAISWRNPRSGDLEGLDVEMAQAFAARLGTPLRFVETNFVEFADRLEKGDCDIAMMGVGVTADRARQMAFSKPYLSSAVYAVTTRENPRVGAWADLDRAGNVVAVAAGTFMESLMRDTLTAAELLVVRQPATREAEVLSGRADAFMSDYPYTRRMTETHAWARVLSPPGRFGDTLYAYAVARQERAWLDEVNTFLTAAKMDGTLARIAARYSLSPIVMY